MAKYLSPMFYRNNYWAESTADSILLRLLSIPREEALRIINDFDVEPTSLSEEDAKQFDTLGRDDQFRYLITTWYYKSIHDEAQREVLQTLLKPWALYMALE